jgi:DNA-binding LacI/PurR family transcriptional regulator
MPEHPPIYLRIYTALKQRIHAREWNYGALFPAENELCEIYNVSRGTIRQVLTRLEKDGLIRRERGRGTFIVWDALNHGGAGLNQKTISFIVPYVRDSYVPSILIGLESAARSNGYSVVFNHVENDLEKQDEILRKAFQQQVAGIVLYPVSSKDTCPMIARLAEENYPLVLVDRYIRGRYIDCVMSDNFGGGLLATQHLLSLNHRRIAFLNWTEMSTAMEHRRAGYQQALFEACIPADPGLEWEVDGYPEIDQVTLEAKLAETSHLTAIFAANDQLAIAVQRAARKLKIAIPEDLALVGFDNLDISAQLDIPLTTIAQPAISMGRTAGELILSKISGQSSGVQCRILPVQLIVRRSSETNETVKGGLPDIW